MRKIVLSVSRNSRVWPVRDGILAQAGGFGVAHALSVDSALQKLDSLPFSAVVLGQSLSCAEKRRFIASVKGSKTFAIVSIHLPGEPESGADFEIEGLGHYELVSVIEHLPPRCA